MQKMFQGIFRFFTFTVYIRIILESFTFILLLSAFELKYYIEDMQGNRASMIVSCVILFFILIFMISIFVSWCANFNVNVINQQSYAKELYNGIRQCPQNKIVQDHNSGSDYINKNEVPAKVKMARLYTLLFVLRRFMIISVMILMEDLVYALKISILILMQLLYLCYIIYSRCFHRVSDQMCEIINEVIY